MCALGALHIHVGVAMLEGDILEQTHRAWDISRGPAETLDTALAMIDEVLARTPDVPVWGISVGIPGPVDFASGRPVAPPIMPGWNGFDIRRRFEERYDAPVWVDNDVNLLALNERARRRDEHLDLIYCKVGSGIGAGLLSQGRIHRGANGAAGDIGHVRVARLGCALPVRQGRLPRGRRRRLGARARRRARRRRGRDRRAAPSERATASRSPPRRSPARPRTATPSRSR